MREMSPTELKAYLDTASPAPQLVDVREPAEYQICHIAGARLIPLAQVPQHLNDLDPDQEIVVICHHGMRSQRAGEFLERNGFTHIINLVGGIDAWAREVDTKMPTY